MLSAWCDCSVSWGCRETNKAGIHTSADMSNQFSLFTGYALAGMSLESRCCFAQFDLTST